MIPDHAGSESVHSPPRSSNLSAFAERFVRPIKEEWLGKMILIGERWLGQAADRFCAHSHGGRNHRGLGNKIIEPDFDADDRGQVICRERLGGFWCYNGQDAASTTEVSGLDTAGSFSASTMPMENIVYPSVRFLKK